MKSTVVQALTSRNSEKGQLRFSPTPPATLLLGLVFDSDAIFIVADDRNADPV
jgi:hypothetical protein